MKRILWVAAAAVLMTGMTTTPAMAAPGPPDHPEWWFDTWNVPGLWASGARGQGITIGEIDTGINASLPELSANVLDGTDFGDFGGNGQTDRDDDEFGHGTAMASLMVAHDGEDNILGIAPDAKVLPIAVPITGTTDDAGDDAGELLLKAIRWAADHSAKIITMSLGAARDPSDVGRSCPADEQEAIDYALSKGDIVVASGGNSGDEGSPVEEPSVCLGVVSVGAVDQSNTVPDWSSKHPYLTVSAPGVGVPSIGRIPGEAFFGDGTSQAAALTSGGLAVIWSKYPQLTGRQVVARLLATLDFKRTTRDPAGGYGVINIGSAVTANVAADAPNPVFDAVDPFLAQDKAVTAVAPDPKVKQATTRRSYPGNFAVAPAPNPLTSGEGLAGIVGGSVGLVVLMFLAIGATRRRRLIPVGVGGGYYPNLPGQDPITEPIPMGPALAALGAQTLETDEKPENATSPLGESASLTESDVGGAVSPESVVEGSTGVAEAPKNAPDSPEPPAGAADTVVDTPDDSADTPGNPAESPSPVEGSVDTRGGVAELPGSLVDTHAGSVDTPGGMAELPGRSVESHAGSVDTPGGMAELPDSPVDTRDGSVDSPEGSADTPAGSVDSHQGSVDSRSGVAKLPGGPVDTHAGSADTPGGTAELPGSSVDTPDGVDSPEGSAVTSAGSVDSPGGRVLSAGDSVDSPESPTDSPKD
jgi:hypothetical protein